MIKYTVRNSSLKFGMVLVFCLLLIVVFSSTTPVQGNHLTTDAVSQLLELEAPNSQLSIKIIESQSINVGHNMDENWLNVATTMGHTASIMPQTTLDTTAFFPTTDILIISSGPIQIPTQRRNIITQFIQQGGSVYIQGEYLCNYESNVTFESIVNTLGGSFTWANTVSGGLNPMNVLGNLSNTPNNVPILSHFWYGCTGSGDSTIENYLEYGGDFFGFIFSPPNTNYGKVVTNSDQDWVRTGAENDLLMENIIAYLENELTWTIFLPVTLK